MNDTYLGTRVSGVLGVALDEGAHLHPPVTRHAAILEMVASEGTWEI